VYTIDELEKNNVKAQNLGKKTLIVAEIGNTIGVNIKK
jgi:hypothetical protein